MLRKRLWMVIKDSMTYGMSGIIGQVAGFLLLPLYTAYLTPEDYGIIAMLTVFIPFYITIAQLGLAHTVFRYYFEKEYSPSLVTSTAFLFVSFTTIILFIILQLLTPLISATLLETTIPNINLIVRIKLLSASIISVKMILVNSLRAKRRVKTVVGANITNVLVSIITAILLIVVFRMGVIGFIIGELVGILFNLTIVVLSSRDVISFSLDRTLLKRMLVYGVPLVPNFILVQSSEMFTKFIIKNRIDLAEVGLYGIAERISMPGKFIYQAFTQGYAAIKFQMLSEGESPQLFFRAAFTYFTGLMLYLWIGIAIWGPEVLYLMTQPAYFDAQKYIAPVAFISVLLVMYNLLVTGVQSGKSQGPMPVVSGIGLVTLVGLVFLLMPRFGGLGVVYGLIGARLIMNVVMYVFSQKRYFIPYNLLGVFLMTALSGAIIWLTNHYTMDGLFLRLGIKTGVSLLAPVLLGVILLAFKTERQQLDNMKKLVTSKFRK